VRSRCEPVTYQRIDIHEVLDSSSKPIKDSKSGRVEATTARGAATALIVRSRQVIYMLITVMLEGRKNSLKGFISIVKLSVRPTLIADPPLLY
jgi:hypothetical protein